MLTMTRNQYEHMSTDFPAPDLPKRCDKALSAASPTLLTALAATLMLATVFCQTMSKPAIFKVNREANTYDAKGARYIALRE